MGPIPPYGSGVLRLWVNLAAGLFCGTSALGQLDWQSVPLNTCSALGSDTPSTQFSCQETPFGTIGLYDNHHTVQHLDFFPVGHALVDGPNTPIAWQEDSGLFAAYFHEQSYALDHASLLSARYASGRLLYIQSQVQHFLVPLAEAGEILSQPHSFLTVLDAQGPLLELPVLGIDQATQARINAHVALFETSPELWAKVRGHAECFAQSEVEQIAASFQHIPAQLPAIFDDTSPEFLGADGFYQARISIDDAWLYYGHPTFLGYGHAWQVGDLVFLYARTGWDKSVVEPELEPFTTYVWSSSLISFSMDDQEPRQVICGEAAKGQALANLMQASRWAFSLNPL